MFSLANVSDVGGGFLRINKLQGALNGKEKKKKQLQRKRKELLLRKRKRLQRKEEDSLFSRVRKKNIFFFFFLIFLKITKNGGNPVFYCVMNKILLISRYASH